MSSLSSLTTSTCSSGTNCAAGSLCTSSSQCATGNCCGYIYNMAANCTSVTSQYSSTPAQTFSNGTTGVGSQAAVNALTACMYQPW